MCYVLRTGLLLASVLLAGVLAEPVLAEAAPAAVLDDGRIFGHLDPLTGIFTPAPASRAAPAAAAAAAKPVLVEGTLVIQAQVDFRASVPQEAVIRAGGIMSVTDEKYSGSVGLQTEVTRTGRTGKATIRLPYLVAAQNRATQMRVTLWLASFDDGIPYFERTQVIPLPADGSTVTVVFAASL